MTAALRRYDDLTGTEKAAALLLSLPAEQSARVLRFLQEPQVERITSRLLQPEQMAPEAHEALLREALDVATAHQYITAGGVDYARVLLAQALGPERANEIINRLLARLEAQPFHFLEGVEPSQIALFLHNQHPQMIAMILSFLSANKTADILALLPERMRPQVSVRLAHIDSINPTIVAQIEASFKKKLSSLIGQDASRPKIGGVDFLVRVLKEVDRSTERAIIAELEVSDPDLADDIKRQMFVFENLTLLDDRSMQRVLREVDTKDMALALRNATETVRDKVFGNMSARAAAMVREEIEMSPPVRMRTIEEAQQRIVEVVRRLEDAEEIVVARGGNDVLL